MNRKDIVDVKDWRLEVLRIEMIVHALMSLLDPNAGSRRNEGWMCLVQFGR